MFNMKYKIITENDGKYQYSFDIILEDGETYILSLIKRGDEDEQIVPNVLYGIDSSKLRAFCEILDHFKKVVLGDCFVGNNKANDYFVSNYTTNKNQQVSVYDISKVKC